MGRTMKKFTIMIAVLVAACTAPVAKAPRKPASATVERTTVCITLVSTSTVEADRDCVRFTVERRTR